MADVTGGTPPTNASPFAVPADITDVYDHFGDQSQFSVATAASLPVSGNWVGRHIYVEDDQATRIWTGSAWYNTTHVPTNRKIDNTNSVANLIIQEGRGKITGNNTAFISEAVTFPVAFAAVPNVQVTAQGSRGAGAFNEAALVGGAVAGNTSAKSTTGFTANISAPGASLSSANDWYYNWIAIGVPA